MVLELRRGDTQTWLIQQVHFYKILRLKRQERSLTKITKTFRLSLKVSDDVVYQYPELFILNFVHRLEFIFFKL
jgi:hypothetical protein